ncbi:NAD(P)H-dependent FAD/FMN reductase [Oceanobacillus oncorhynchi]|uniref:NAD(P)H-dependent FAD/FMN reductase n=1 Tax=Oceanobacillus oncorhynchi TaxID=545501 RepID=A0A0A1M8S3_9BACI|nr:NADPH-dependent FMN reductase [Oceanobacillus oncorhynchi]CEI81725.1 NAD(P)H-dependent FAD/FMN reductase [Oceanobacillus oncorhynchi]
MKIIGLSGSIVGSKTRTVMDAVAKEIAEKYPEADFQLIDLKDYDLQFSDGRNYLDYSGDTAWVTRQVMEADVMIIGTPVFQASIPASLKNIFDLLPVGAFQDKTVSFFVTAGSSKHYLVADHQLKPTLSYMKAQIVQTFVYVEEKSFQQKKIVDDDVFIRLERLIEDTMDTYEANEIIRKKKEDSYGF